MDDHVAKPVQPAELHRLLERWIVDTGDLAAPSGGGSSMLDPAGLEALRNLEEGDPGGVASMIRLFLLETRGRLDTLREAPGDAGLVERTAHMLSGSCASFTASEMASLCRELSEAAARSGLPVTEETLDRLDVEYGRVAAALGSAFQI